MGKDMLYVINRYSIVEQWNFPLLLLLLILGYMYLSSLKRSKTRSILLKASAFGTASFLFFLVSGTPFLILTHDYLFLFKMVKESTLFFAIPLLLIYSLPNEVLTTNLWNHRIKKVVVVVTNPLAAMLQFYVFYTFYHTPTVFSFFMNNTYFNGVFEGILFILSLTMWWSIISPVSGINHLPETKRVVFVLINTLLLFIPMYSMAFFTLPTYSYLGHELLAISPKEDFKIGATVIFVYQKISVCIFFAFLFFSWFKREDKIDPIDVSGALGIRDLTTKK